MTHAYAGIKLLVQRARLMTHDLLLAASGDSPRTNRIASRMTSCAEMFLGAVLRDWAPIDPASAADAPLAFALRRLACDAIEGETPQPASELCAVVPHPASREADAIHLN